MRDRVKALLPVLSNLLPPFENHSKLLGALNLIFLANENQPDNNGDHNDHQSCQQAIEEIY